MFDWENAIALDKIQGNRASSRREGESCIDVDAESISNRQRKIMGELRHRKSGIVKRVWSRLKVKQAEGATERLKLNRDEKILSD